MTEQTALEPANEQTTEQKELFYGDEKVLNIEQSVIPGFQRVTTEKGSFDAPEWEVTACVSQDKEDRTYLLNQRANYVVDQLLKLLNSLDIRVEELSFYMTKMIKSMELNEDAARLRAFGFKPDTMMDLNDMSNEIRMSLLDKFMKS